jgi:hypothetical protein
MTAVETVWVDYEALMHEREQRQDDDEELLDGRERLPSKLGYSRGVPHLAN